MNITFLGTGAADWVREQHGHMAGFRRRSALLVDDCLLIDPGPDVPDALQTFGKDPAAIRHILVTHRHADHFSADTVAALPHAELRTLRAGEVQTVGDYTVSAFAANHATCREAVHFIVTDGEKRLFYGLDGAWLRYGEVKAIKKTGVDLAVLDATVGDIPGDYRIFEHNNLTMIREMKAALAPYVGRWVISHMARTLHTGHDELSARMAADGIETAFDGYETSL